MTTAQQAPEQQAPDPRSPLARVFRNVGWLLGGKGFGAVCGLAYLAILTRSLGLEGFGHFSLIFGTAQALIAIAGFQTWRVVVRFGSTHVHMEDWPKFGRLAMLSGMLDAIGAVCGCIIAGVLIYGFGHLLDIDPAFADMAFYFNCAMVWAIVSAPTGIVRALHRFDVAVYVEAIVPVGRLLAALAIWAIGPTVARFLIAWALIDLLEAAFYWIASRRLRPEAIRLRYVRDWRTALEENPGVGRFFLVTYTGATLDALVRYGPLLAVGGLVGTAAAGLYRLAAQLTQALSKLSTLLTRAVYAEVARVRAASTVGQFRKLAAQTTMIAGLTGAVVVVFALVAGRSLIVLIGSDEFANASVILVPLAIAASFDLASVPFEPVLHSTGRAGKALAARVMAVIALGIGLWLFIGAGATGAAWAVALGASVGYAAMSLMSYLTLQRIASEEAAG